MTKITVFHRKANPNWLCCALSEISDPENPTGFVPEDPWLVVVGGGGGGGADFSGRTFLGFHAAAARRMADPHTFPSPIPERKEIVSVRGMD
jgi:hypothetical protein